MTIRIGILGAAAIAPSAVIDPVRDNPDFEVIAVAARDPDRAKAYAAKHGIPHVSGSYDALIQRDDIDLVYNPLPPAGHATWSIAALKAGKHVLCEKPFALNAAQARRMSEAAATSGRKLIEAFHYRHHNVMKRAVEIVRSRELGAILHAYADHLCPLSYLQGNYIWDRDLGGGTLMDQGCYAIHALRSVLDAEPDVRSATCKTNGGVDVMTSANLEFSRVPAQIYCSMNATGYSATLRLECQNGRMEIENYGAPQFSTALGGIDCRFTVQVGETVRQEPTMGLSTYAAQLAELGDVLLRGKPQLVTNADSLANMIVIDAIYAAGGISRPFE